MRNLFYSVSVSFITLGNSVVFLSPIQAQVTLDNTTETTITKTPSGVQIDDGNREGDNLFHSFQEFSIPTGREAFFNNELDVVNIFSRVTGGNISSIDGLIRSNGGANLFLVNPAGIIFRENARLDIGGSFYGSTAESILFPDGIEFSATNIQQPFLTINAPIGLNFRDNPGAIVNRSFVVNSTETDFVGLEVNSGETLALVGGDINFEGGEATAKGGNIEIGGLSAAGTVSLNDDGSLSFPQNIARADITLNNRADIDVSGRGGGNVTVNGRNITLQSGEFGQSQIRAGIIADSDSTNNPGGDITINATGDLVIDQSFVYNQIEPETTQNTGDINISANSISISNPGGISNNNFGAGQVGDINISTNTLSVSNSGNEGIRSSTLGTGNGGNINISTNSLSVSNGGRIRSSTFSAGNAGLISIEARDSVTLSNTLGTIIPITTISSTVQRNATGNSQGIAISTGSLSVRNGAFIDTTTIGKGDAGLISIEARDKIILDAQDGLFTGILSIVEFDGEGNAGDVNISTGSLSIINGGEINTRTLEKGNGGSVFINATDGITLTGNVLPGRIFSEVIPGAEGNSGNVTINTNSLSLSNGGLISTTTRGAGNAGFISINSTEKVTLDGESITNVPSTILSEVAEGAIGDAGEITIITDSLSVTNGGAISASTVGEGNAGLISLNATERAIFDGESTQGNPSGVFSNVESGAIGNSSGIDINTGSLLITNRAVIAASSDGAGSAGDISINASDSVELIGNESENFVLILFNEGLRTRSLDPNRVRNGILTLTTDRGAAGNLTIDTNNLILQDGGIISSSTFGEGDAGDLTVKIAENTKLISSGLFAFTTDTGAAGNLIIDTGNLIIRDGTLISTSTLLGSGDAGDLTVRASDAIEITSVLGINNPTGLFSNTIGGAGKAGNIDIDTQKLILRGGTQINSVTGTSGVVGDFGLIAIGGLGGNIVINASESVEISGTSADGLFPSIITAETFSFSSAGAVIVTTENLIIEDQGQIATNAFNLGDAGDVNITADNITIIGESPDSEFRSGFGLAGSSGIFAIVQPNARGAGGEILISTDNLLIRDGGGISASTSGSGDSGEVRITGKNIVLTGSGQINAISSGMGNSGDILVTTDTLTLDDRSLINAQAGENVSGGDIDIKGKFIIAFPSRGNGNDIIANAQRGRGGNIEITAEALLGIEERRATPENRTNDIDASSQFGLNGNVTFNIPDTNSLQEAVNLPSNTLSTETVTANNCSTNTEVSSLIVQGRGGVSSAPDLPLDAEVLLGGQEPLALLHNQETNSIIQPVKTAQGDIYPARGVVVNEDGTVTLTAHANNQLTQRNPQKLIDCQ